MWIVRIDIPNHPIEEVRQNPRYLFDDRTTMTRVRGNAKRFNSETRATEALTRCVAHWTRIFPQRRYVGTVENLGGHKVRWVVKATWGVGTRGYVARHDPLPFVASGIEAELYENRDEAEADATVWLTRAPANTHRTAVAVPRRVPL